MTESTGYGMIDSTLHSSVRDEVYFQCSEVDAAAGAGINIVPMVDVSAKTQVWRT